MAVSLQTLNMLIGAKVVLSTDRFSTDSYEAKFIGYANDQSLIFSTPICKETPVLANIGEEFIVSFHDGEKQLSFRSEVLEVRDFPYAYIHMRFPKEIEKSSVRNFPRYLIEQEKVPMLHLTLTNTNQNTKVKMSDISLKGACLIANSQLGKINDTFSINVIVDRKPLTLSCRTCYIRIENHKAGPTEFIHGVEFQNLSLESQLFIDQFIQKYLTSQRTAV